MYKSNNKKILDFKLRNNAPLLPRNSRGVKNIKLKEIQDINGKL